MIFNKNSVDMTEEEFEHYCTFVDIWSIVINILFYLDSNDNLKYFLIKEEFNLKKEKGFYEVYYNKELVFSSEKKLLKPGIWMEKLRTIFKSLVKPMIEINAKGDFKYREVSDRNFMKNSSTFECDWPSPQPSSVNSNLLPDHDDIIHDTAVRYLDKNLM